MPSKYLHTLFWILLSIFSLTQFTACGGGGKAAERGTVFGTVAKGLVQKGLVEAFELDDVLIKGNLTFSKKVGAAVTDDNGKFTMKLFPQYSLRPIRLIFTARSDTSMTCDVHSDVCEYGKRVLLPEKFTMDAILPVVPHATRVKAQVTPYTDMAFSRALNTDSLTVNKINAANSEISQMLGFDVLAVEPADITNLPADASDESLLYAAFLAGAGKLILEDPDAATKGAEKFGEAFADGAFSREDAVSIKKLLASTRSAAESAGINNTKAINQFNVVEAQIGPDDSYNPEPSPPFADDIALAKTLVGEVRSFLTDITADPFDAFSADIKSARKVLNQNSQALIEMFTNVITQVAEDFDGKTEEELLQGDGKHTVQITDASNTPIGSVVATVSTDAQGIKVEITEAETALPNGIQMSFILRPNTSIDALRGVPFELTSLDINLSGRISNSEVTLAMTDFQLIGNLPAATTINQLNEPLRDLNLGKVTLTGTIDISNTQNAINYSGAITLSTVGLESNTPKRINTMSLEKAVLDGTLSSNDGRSFTAKFELVIDNAASFDTFAFLNYEPIVNVSGISTTDPFNTRRVLDAKRYFNAVTLHWDSTTDATRLTNADESIEEIAGDIAAVEVAENRIKKTTPGVTRVKLSSLDFDWSVDASTTKWAGIVDFGDFETAENFVQATLTVTSKLELPGRKDTTAVLTVNREEQSKITGVLTLTNAGRNLSIAAAKIEDNPAGFIAIFTNSDDAKMTIKVIDGEASGAIEVDRVVVDEKTGGSQTFTTQVATITQTDNGVILIRYADDGKDVEFESLQ
ncbi:MAG TPA: hypothetical protein ENJ84_04080 [Gammaproteobacteria bacterium]|nr:hypothetical protein [Gammaproteobacteria bacterium]